MIRCIYKVKENFLKKEKENERIGIVSKENINNGIDHAEACLFGCSADKFDEEAKEILKALQKYLEKKKGNKA